MHIGNKAGVNKMTIGMGQMMSKYDVEMMTSAAKL